MTTPPLFRDFPSAIRAVQRHLRQNGNHVETESWQAMKNPPKFYEALNVSFSAVIPHASEWVDQIKPNEEWADEHFAERIGGEPLNPGKSYKNWPMYKNNPHNDTSRDKDGKFSHTYMERIWPRFANRDENACNIGIRHPYGDLNFLIQLLNKEPFTRQAYLPIWFPEDGTAALVGERVPCTLGYHFIRRGHNMHVVYYIRSCDFFRHFRDDIYLTIKLLYFILSNLRDHSLPVWGDVTLGTFTMHVTSLHIFSKEYNLLKD